MIRRPPRSTRTDTLFPYTTLFRSGAVPASASVQLMLEDGSEYGPRGTVEFSEVVVDPNTGTVTMRARFPNPQGLLLPGMFVRARFTQAIDPRAFLVPEQRGARDPKGNATALNEGPEHKGGTSPVKV